MAHDDMGAAFSCMQQAIAGIGETLCLEHASLLKARENSLSLLHTGFPAGHGRTCAAQLCAAPPCCRIVLLAH